MDELTYIGIQETIWSAGRLRTERAGYIRKAKTYRRRALCLTGRLAEEREYRRTAEAVAEVMQAHAAAVEQELMDALSTNESLAALLRRAYAELIRLDAAARSEIDRPEPGLINDIGSARTGTCSLPLHYQAGKEQG